MDTPSRPEKDQSLKDLCNLTENLSLKEKKVEDFQLYPLKNHKYFQHQIDAGKWMRNQEKTYPSGFRGGVISLTMGLGKTLLILGYSLAYNCRPTLIIVPKNILFEWKNNGVDKFFVHDKNVKVLYFHKDLNKNIDSLTREEIINYNLIITTYSVCLRTCYLGEYHKTREERVSKLIYQNKGCALLYNITWNRIVFDESHKCCNPTTKTFKYLMALKAKNKWCMSGTPIINYDTDIWSQLALCGYTEVETARKWKVKGVLLFNKSLKNSIYSLQYSDVNIELPALNEKTITIELNTAQKKLYNILLKNVKREYKDMIKLDESYSCVFTLLTRLRQAAIAPYIISSEAKRSLKKSKCPNNFNLDKKLHGMQSCKILKTIDLLKKIKHKNNAKTIVYSMFVSALDLLSETIHEYLPNFKLVQIDGQTTNREQLLHVFKHNSDIDCLLTTYKIAAEGLTLTQATHCILLEPWWNSATLQQAKSRLWRIGQTQPVNVYTLIAKDTIEEKILEICNKKDTMINSYLDGTKQKITNCGLNRATLHKLLNN